MDKIEQPNNTESLQDKYISQADEEGYIFTSAFSVPELRRQNKSVAALLDGDEGTGDYNLGDGIRFKGKSCNYPDMKIHIDDLDEFVKRVRKHYGESS